MAFNALDKDGNVVTIQNPSLGQTGKDASLPVVLPNDWALPAGANVIGKVDIDASLKSGSKTHAAVNATTSSVAILAANPARKSATIYNSDPNPLLLDLTGGAASATRCHVRLLQYESYEIGNGYVGAITGLWTAAGGGQASIAEFSA